MFIGDVSRHRWKSSSSSSKGLEGGIETVLRTYSKYSYIKGSVHIKKKQKTYSHLPLVVIRANTVASRRFHALQFLQFFYCVVDFVVDG